MAQHNRILIVRTDRIGDVVLATPLIRALRETFPYAFIAAMVRPYTKDVLANNPHLSEILVDDVEGERKGYRGFWKQVQNLRMYQFDTALLLLPTERAAWMLFFAGIKTRIGVGRKFYEVITFMKSVDRHGYKPLRHEADYCLDLGKAIGVKDVFLKPEILLTADERQHGMKILQDAGVRKNDLIIGIHPGSGGSSPNWRIEKYVELAEKILQEHRAKIVITGDRHEKYFSEHFQKIRSPHLIDLIGELTLRELIAVISHYTCLFSPSTGPMHIAAALGVPTVSIFCPLPACSPMLWGPLGNYTKVILPPEDFCQNRCPVDPKICTLEEISVGTALRSTQLLVKEIRKSKR